MTDDVFDIRKTVDNRDPFGARGPFEVERDRSGIGSCGQLWWRPCLTQREAKKRVAAVWTRGDFTAVELCKTFAPGELLRSALRMSIE